MATALKREEMVEKLCRLAAEQVAISPAEVTENSDLFTDLGFDSLNAVEYIMTIEDEFDVIISDEIAGKVRTVREAVDALSAVLV